MKKEKEEYELDLLTRYEHGEFFSADSIKQNTKEIYYTSLGRPVYGGGGIMPDIFVPQDTIGMTSYLPHGRPTGADHPVRLRLYRQKPECPQGIRYGRETGKLSENPEPAEHFCQLGGKRKD